MKSLYVDDELNIKYFCLMFKKYAKIVTASSAVDAKVILNEIADEVSMVISDHCMTGESGE